MELDLALIMGIISLSVLIFIFIPLLLSARGSILQTVNSLSLASYFFIKSLSLIDIILLSLSKDDRTGFIKDFYDFKHQNLIVLIKGISSVIILNLGIIFGNYFGDKERDIIKNEYDYILIILTFILVVINVRYFIKLNECVAEFNKAVKLYGLLKST